jgi:hypothetical protein
LETKRLADEAAFTAFTAFTGFLLDAAGDAFRDPRSSASYAPVGNSIGRA